MSVPTHVVIRVELPAYSRSFDVQVPESATVLDVKQAISSVCIGHPHPEGQRVIWRGRCLDDQEKISELWPVRSYDVGLIRVLTPIVCPVPRRPTYRPSVRSTIGLDE